MANEQISLIDVEALLDRKERELIAQRLAVWKFIDTEHTASETKKYQIQLRKSDAEIGAILVSLLENKGIAAEFKAEADKLCQRCRDLGDYTRDMNKILAEDLAEKNRKEAESKMDFVKEAGLFIAIPTAFATNVKNVVGDEHAVYHAIGVGTAVSSAIAARKKLLSAFKEIKKSICEAPQKIKNSYFIYYMKETFKEQSAATINSFHTNADLMRVRIASTASRGKKFIARLTKDEPEL